MITVPVNSNDLLKRFIKFPHHLYKYNRYWVPKLISEEMKFFNPEKNPYYLHSEIQPFIALENGEVIGRITAHTNTQHNKTHNDKVGFFGFFESYNNQMIADNLFHTATEWLRNRGCDTIRGPMNLSTNDECGLLIENFNSVPYIMMPYNYEYYQTLIENFGFKKEMDLYAYSIKVQKTPERIKRLTKKLQARGNFTIRSLSKNKQERKKDIETVFNIYTKAWEKNWGFVPMTKAEFNHTVEELLPIALPEFIFIAEVEGKPAGFSMTLPDYNYVLKKMNGHILPLGIFKALYYKNKIKRLRVITMGVIKEFQNRGIDTVFYAKSFETAYNHKHNFTDSEFSWVLETNKMMNRIAKSIGGTKYKTYRIFDKEI